MSTVVRARAAAMPALALVLAGATASDAWAQAAQITGRVTNEQGAPVAGATVAIPVLNLATTANATGNFTLTVPEARATGQVVSMTARFIGFTPMNRQVTLTGGAQTQNFTLRIDPFRLSEVVVTGVAEATSSRKLTFSVARVSEEQLKQVPASSPVAALAGKVAGARVAIGRGNPGAAPTIRLRGSTSLGVGNSTPLIIVDGVITRNSIQDIDANDIASIEVLKGAAAASYYGSDAANGVINITTKRSADAADNKVNFTLRSEAGQTGVVRYVPLNQSHVYETNPDGTIRTTTGGTRVVASDQFADNPFPATGENRFRNQLEEWLTNGTFYLTNLQLGARFRNTNFNSSFSSTRNQGVLPMTNGLFQQNARLNVDQGLGAKADFSASVTYGLQNNDYDPTGSAGWFALLQSPPDLDLRRPNGNDTIPFYPRLPDAFSPNARGNPLYQFANEDFNQRRERILGSFAVRYRPWEWLRLEGNYGTDRLNRADRTYQFRGYLGEGGQATPGSLDRSTINNVAENTQASATASKLFFNNLLSTTRAAWLLENDRRNSFSAATSKLNVSDVPDLAAADPTQLSVNSGDEFRRTLNYTVSQALDFKDRYLLDVLYRRDGSSLFGAEQRWQNFYRLSGAYRISEDLRIPGVQEFKVRAARGTAGLRPGFFDQYETYSLAAGQISKNQLGNRELRPAIQTENEYGLNVSFLDRFDAELVYSKRLTEGAFLNVPLSLAQSGGFSSQLQNAADVSGNTVELMLQTRVFDRPNFAYSFTLTGDRTRQRIERMNRAPFRVNAGGQGQDVFYYKAGEPLGIIYGSRWVRSFDELKQNPANASANPADFVVNPAGFLVRAANRGKTNEAPIAYVNGAGESQFKIGDVNPDFNFGFANNLRWRGVGLYVLFDGQRGGDIYNFTKQWMYQDFRHADQDQRGKPDDQKIANPFYASGLYNALSASDHFVEDGSFVKLRELSVNYALPSSLLNRVGVGRYANTIRLALIGRNLYTWTSYTGFDPEVTSGNDFNFRIDGFRYPQFRTVTGQLTVEF